MERIDKLLRVCLNISRRDATALIKKGLICVDGNVVTSTSLKFDENKVNITYNGKLLSYNKYVYIMMNKPKGVISASEGSKDKTVVDILPESMKRKKLFPAGRLDKDTTGFVLITDDGDFAHRILSPKKHIPKTYIAQLDKPINDDVIVSFEKGVELKDDLCMPAKLKSLNEEKTIVEVEIKQGMYHQIKRMFLKFGITVLELKRTKMGDLLLDENLKSGECRYLTDEELVLIETR